MLSNGKTVAACTVRDQLLLIGYKSYTAQRKPCRTGAQKRQRLDLATKFIYSLPDDWKSIIWSDEPTRKPINHSNTYLEFKMEEAVSMYGVVWQVLMLVRQCSIKVELMVQYTLRSLTTSYHDSFTIHLVRNKVIGSTCKTTHHLTSTNSPWII